MDAIGSATGLAVLALVTGAIALMRLLDPARSQLARLIRARGGGWERGGGVVERDGVEITVSFVKQGHFEWLELRGGVLVPPGLRLVRRERWGDALPGAMDAAVWELPAIERGEHRTVQTDEPETLASLAELDGAIARLLTRIGELVLACDGRRVVMRLAAGIEDEETLDGVLEVIARIATFDRGAGAALDALPGAVRLVGHRLAPGVSLATDGLLIGVRDGKHTIAQLDGIIATPAEARAVGGEVELVEGALDGATVTLLRQAGDGDLLVVADAARFAWRGMRTGSAW